jgi:hypothetical protein
MRELSTAVSSSPQLACISKSKLPRKISFSYKHCMAAIGLLEEAVITGEAMVVANGE